MSISAAPVVANRKDVLSLNTASYSRKSAKVVRKAVFPVAGLGTRFLPATKAVAKEMLPIVDRPLVQYAVDEAAAAGIEEIIFVTHRSKRSIEDHLHRSMELETELASQGKHASLKMLRQLMPNGVRFSFVRQEEPRGLGHAIQCARHLVGNEPFAVLLPDDLMDGQPPVLAQMISQYEQVRSQPRGGTHSVSRGDPALRNSRCSWRGHHGPQHENPQCRGETGAGSGPLHDGDCRSIYPFPRNLRLHCEPGSRNRRGNSTDRRNFSSS